MDLSSVGEFFGGFLHLKPNEYLYLVLMAYGLYIGTQHLREIVADYVEIGENPYRVKTTMVKDLFSEHRTERTKLRQLRVAKTCDSLQIDPWPKIDPYRIDVQERRAKVSRSYSLPGRADVTQDGNWFLVSLARDEKLRRHRNHSVLLSYTIEEEIEALVVPRSGVVARQPVGKDRLVYEVHLPPKLGYVRDAGGKAPEIEVHMIVKDKNDKVHKYPLERERWRGLRKRWEVVGDRNSFGPNDPEHDWFRVTINKPPQKGEGIRIGWFWDNSTVTQS